MTDHHVGWLFLAAGWLLVAVGLLLAVGPWGLVAAGLFGVLVGVAVVDWEAVSTVGEPAVPHPSHRGL